MADRVLPLVRSLAAGREADDLLCVTSSGHRLHASAFKRTLGWASIAQGRRIHDLRHTAVALWIAAGAGPKEVATRAGHMSVSFTLDRYGHLYPEADRALRDRLDRFHEAAGDAE